MAATHNTKEVVATVTLTNSIKDITKNEWDICAGVDNPFLSYDFMSSLEDSGSVGPETGWLPQHLLYRNSSKKNEMQNLRFRTNH